MPARSKSKGFYPYWRKDTGRWAIKYLDPRTRKWREHRIPADLPRPIVTESDAEKYGAAWYAEWKKMEAEAPPPPDPAIGITFRKFAEDWTTGALAKKHPDHVRVKVTADDDASRLKKYVYPVIGNVPLSSFVGPTGLELAESVMAALPPPPKLSRNTRRQIAQVMHRVLGIAVYPAKLLPANPLPKGFLPKKSEARAKTYLFPDEDAKLLGYMDAPLGQRLLYGVLAREGLRSGEAMALQFRDLDLDRGFIYLDENKTDDPRMWALQAGVVEALTRWKDHFRRGATKDDLVFTHPDGKLLDKYDLASDLRAFLKLAKVDRPQLFEASAIRQPIRAHDLRATFITLALANGRTETWVADRTGHKSSQMINVYRRAARSAAEANLGELRPLVDAIPELAKLVPITTAKGTASAG